MTEEHRFCPRCAAPLEMREVQGTQRPRCPACGRIVYQDPKLAAAVVVEQDEKLLMVRRAIQPGIGLWSFPGGYVDQGEVVEKAAAREVLEETGLQVDIIALLGIFSEDGHPVVLAAYGGKQVGGEIIPGDEVLEMGFFSPNGLPPLAFSRDLQVLDAWQRLKANSKPHDT